MKNRHKMLMVLLGSTMMLALCSCGKKDEPVDTRVELESSKESENAPTEETETENISSESSESTESDESDEEGSSIESSEDNEVSSELTNSNFNNSIALLDKIYADTKENTMISPLSLNMALSMMAEGTAGNTRNEILSYLGDECKPDNNIAYLGIVDSMYNSEDEYMGYKNVLEISNSVWHDNSISIKDEYKEFLQTGFVADVNGVEFMTDPEGAANQMNKWCKDKTHGLIEKMIDGDKIRSSGIVLTLANSVYFESPWTDSWSLADSVNEDKTFTKFDGTKIENTQYISDKFGGYKENDKAEAISCYYNNGIKFTAILPKDEGEFNISDLDINGLMTSSYITDYDVMVKMPYINFSSDMSLGNSLRELGINGIFGAGDFSPMTDNNDITVSDVLQSTKIELDENGTKAAAVTSIQMRNTAVAELKDIKNIEFNRPFVFMIQDEDNNQTLFMGKVVNITDDMMIK